MGSVSTELNGIEKISPVPALIDPLSNPMVIVVLKSASGPALTVPENWVPPPVVGMAKNPLKASMPKLKSTVAVPDSTRLRSAGLLIDSGMPGMPKLKGTDVFDMV